MELYANDTKTHDEARQGEAFASNGPEKHFEKFFYVESYGCAMNFADSEVVASILLKENIACTSHPNEADIILINTCSIREKAEEKIRKRLTEFKSLKKQKPEKLTAIGAHLV